MLDWRIKSLGGNVLQYYIHVLFYMLQFCRQVWLGLYDTRSRMEPDSKDENKIRDFMTQKYEKKRYALLFFSVELQHGSTKQVVYVRLNILETFVTLKGRTLLNDHILCTVIVHGIEDLPCIEIRPIFCIGHDVLQSTLNMTTFFNLKGI